MVKNARRWIEKHGKVDTGNYRDSLFAEVTNRRGQANANRRTSGAGWISRGQRWNSGAGPAADASGRRASPWMARHGIPESAEFVILRAIGRNG